jgi:hypothetical protein
MKEITLPIGKLFEYIESTNNVKAEYDESLSVPFELNIKDEYDNWVPVPRMYKKRALAYAVTFSDGSECIMADDHLFSLKGKECIFAKDLKAGDHVSYLDLDVTSVKRAAIQDVFSPEVQSESHLYQDTKGLIHHNTYTCRQSLHQNISKSPTGAQEVYEKGDVGSAITNLVYFLYKNKDNKIIILDDNDKMIMTNVPQNVRNILKGVMDPDALDQPVSISASVRNIVQARFDQESEAKAERGSMNESLKNHLAAQLDRCTTGQASIIEINRDRLKEGVFELKINGREVINNLIPLNEALELRSNIRDLTPLRETEKPYVNPYAKSAFMTPLQEARGSMFEDDNDEWAEDDDERLSARERAELETLGSTSKKKGKKEKMIGDVEVESPFIFDSSIIFISNLKMKNIDSAVLDRVISQEVDLTLDEFMTRVSNEAVLKALGVKAYADIDSSVLNWAKKSVLGVLETVIDCWKARSPLFGKQITIKRKLTFRAVEFFTQAWLEKAWSFEDMHGGKYTTTTEAGRRLISVEIEPEVVRTSVLPWLATTTADAGK